MAKLGKTGTTSSGVSLGVTVALLLVATAVVTLGRLSLPRAATAAAAAPQTLSAVAASASPTHALAVTDDSRAYEAPRDSETVSSPSDLAIDRPLVSVSVNTAVAASTATPDPTLAPAVPSSPRPLLTAAPTTAPVAVPAGCPSDWLCYPRLGLAGPIVPYTDCSGSTDVGTSIRSYSCLSDTYLMGHAYTSFGLVRGWIAGDKVVAYGKTFTVTGAITQSACSAPVLPLAPLSMQTSLTSRTCGEVLVVQAR